MAPDRIPRVLSIAGSDSGGGAGIQADLKAFARCRVHGMTAITAITAQNTLAVTAVYPLPPEVIVEQVRAVADDIGVDAVKIGMLGTVETIEAVGTALDLIPDAPVVLDPVMVAESGARLLDENAQEALTTLLVPRAAVVTPNVPEARALAGGSPADDGAQLARAVHALGPAAVVVTGGGIVREGVDAGLGKTTNTISRGSSFSGTRVRSPCATKLASSMAPVSGRHSSASRLATRKRISRSCRSSVRFAT